MARLSPDQLRTRRQVEGVIRLIAPALDVLLAVGDRVSRAVARDDIEYYPPRVRSEEPPPRDS
jgi:hypothetical protein